jgi:NAD(P)-dependent dehydrogenase (short-subunit alcohol dehydrogenase family)
MIAARRGKIVNVAAAGAFKGAAAMGAYAASKNAVARLTESMSMELREHGINVNAVAPSIIDTAPNRNAMPDADPKRWVSTSDLAKVVGFLAGADSAAIHGAIVPVVGLS